MEHYLHVIADREIYVLVQRQPVICSAGTAVGFHSQIGNVPTVHNADIVLRTSVGTDIYFRSVVLNFAAAERNKLH